MNTERLRELAQAVTHPDKWYKPEDLYLHGIDSGTDTDFIAAANPQVVLELLDEIAALRRGQGRAPAPAQAGPVRAPLHETHSIPDSTKEGDA